MTGKFSNSASIFSNMAKMLGILFITVAIGEVLHSINTGKQFIIIVYLLAIQVISAVTSTYIYGILAAVISAFIYDYQTTDPQPGFSLTISLPITLFIMCLISITISTITMRIKSLLDEHAGIVIKAERERMRCTLLSSVSHDLRTPLTGILGTSSTILEQKGIDSTTLMNLVKDIKENVQWLIRMVENILVITRVSGDNITVIKESEAAEEVISEAVSIVRKRFPAHCFNVHIPDELLLVRMDGTLIKQVLINLLENAAKNSPDRSQITVDLKKEDGCAKFDIIDNGSGIPEYLLGNLFKVHPAPTEQLTGASRGTGLGLLICKTIIQAHGGTIKGSNGKQNGAIFSFQLPL